MIDKAIEAMLNSYSPYSNFKVGASLLTKDGKIITGTNIENKSYGLTICAERVCLFNAYALGYRKDDIVKFCVVSKNITTPCGACREVMNELLNQNTPVILSDINKNTKELKVSDLLPFAFEMRD